MEATRSGGSSRMRHQYTQDYHARSRGGGGRDGAGTGVSHIPPGCGIPPMAMPSLSTGQGFYTVESLQGATVVPPPQISPALPPLPHDPFLDDRIHGPRHFDDNRTPPQFHQFVGRSGFPHLNPPVPRHHAPFVMPHPPPFAADPRLAGFHPGIRESHPGGSHGPLPWAPEFDPHFDRRHHQHQHQHQHQQHQHHHHHGHRSGGGSSRIDHPDRSRPHQRSKFKKQFPKRDTWDIKARGSSGDPVTQKQEHVAQGGPGWCSVCEIDCHTSETLKKHLAGKRHKRQLDGDKEGTKRRSSNEEAKEVATWDDVPREAENSSIVTDDPNPEGVADTNLTDVAIEVAEETETYPDAGPCDTADMRIDTGIDSADEVAVVSEEVETKESVRVTAEVAIAASVSIEVRETVASPTDSAAEDQAAEIVTEVTSTKDNEISMESEDLESTRSGGSSSAEVTEVTISQTVEAKEVVVTQSDKAKEAAVTQSTEAKEVAVIQSVEAKEAVVIQSAKAKEVAEIHESSSASNKRAAQGTADATTTPKKARGLSSPKAEPFRQVCELCNVTCTSKNMLENHLKTKKHAANLKKIAAAPNVSDKKDKTRAEEIDKACRSAGNDGQ